MSPESLLAPGLVVTAYLLGSLSSAIIICRLMGLPDPRSQGSGNPGATNILRIGGRQAAAIVLMADLLKGFIPTWVALLYGLPSLWVIIVGLGAFGGHLYPLFFGFKGGKGVATFIGILLGMNWMLGLAAAITWLVVAKIVKTSSLSALVMAAFTPLYSSLIYRDWPVTAIIGAIVVILFWRHRRNIHNLMRGTETRPDTPDETPAPGSPDHR